MEKEKKKETKVAKKEKGEKHAATKSSEKGKEKKNHKEGTKKKKDGKKKSGAKQPEERVRQLVVLDGRVTNDWVKLFENDRSPIPTASPSLLATSGTHQRIV